MSHPWRRAVELYEAAKSYERACDELRRADKSNDEERIRKGLARLHRTRDRVFLARRNFEMAAWTGKDDAA